MNENIYLCSFCDTALTPSAKRLNMQAREFGVFKDIFLYNENMLTGEFKEYFKDKLVPSRGYGYWVWKPYIILETMKKLNYGDILLYLDIGCHLVKNNKSMKKFNEYIDMVKEKDVLSFYIEEIQSCWTKQDMFSYFNVVNNKNITETEQIEAGVIFIKKTDKNISILEQWLKVYYDDFSLASDTPSKIPNPAHFIENRHDQSIWSILVKINGLCIIDKKETFLILNNIYLPDYPIQTRRDKVKIDNNFFDVINRYKFFTLKIKILAILHQIAWWIPSKKLRDNFRENYIDIIIDKIISILNNTRDIDKLKNICDENNKYQIAGNIQINDEELCPCYSGKKYKNCHGKNKHF